MKIKWRILEISQEVNCYAEGQSQQVADQKLLNIMNTFSLAVNMLQECGERAVTVPENHTSLQSDMHLQALGTCFPSRIHMAAPHSNMGTFKQQIEEVTVSQVTLRRI